MSSAPVIRPTNYALWASGISGYVAEPIAADKAQGFLPTGIARSSYVNWLLNANGQWNQYLDQQDRGRVFRESWSAFSASVTAYAGRIPENARWSASATGADAPAFNAGTPAAQFSELHVNMDPGRAAGSKMTIASSLRLVGSGVSGSIQSFVGDIALRTITGDATFAIGVAAMANPIPAAGPDLFTGISGLNATGYAWFRKPAGISAWLAEVAPTGVTAASSINTGVVPKGQTDGVQQLRVDLCAANSPFGAITRFLIDGALVATGPAYARGGSIAMGIRTDASGTQNLFVGTTDWNVYK